MNKMDCDDISHETSMLESKYKEIYVMVDILSIVFRSNKIRQFITTS